MYLVRYIGPVLGVAYSHEILSKPTIRILRYSVLAIDLSYNDIKHRKTLNAMSQGRLQMMFLLNLLAQQQLGYKLVFHA